MKRLQRGLDLPIYGANGIVERLIHFAAEHARRGDVGRFTDRDIADAVGWDGEDERLVAALVEAGWLDASSEHRFVLHDWSEHADDGVNARLARAREFFVDGKPPSLRKLERAERALAESWYAQNAASIRAEQAPAGRPAMPRRTPSGASPLPLPLPEEGKEGDRAPRGAPPAPMNGEARGTPEHWVGVLAKKPGSIEFKLQFLAELLPRIESEAIAALKPACRDPEAIREKTRSMILAWYEQRLKGPPPGRHTNGRVAGPRLMTRPAEQPPS